MTAHFDLIKATDQKTKDIVNGFIRDSQNLLPNDKNQYYNIPSLVFIITILYYYNPEYFTIHGDLMELNQDKNIVTMNGFYSSTSIKAVYGNVMIEMGSTGKHIWTFNIIKPNQQAIIVIGIDSSNKQFINSDMNTTSNYYPFYGYQSYGDDIMFPAQNEWPSYAGYRIYNESVDKNTYEYDYGDVYSDAKNEIKMELNMDNKTLKYYVNGKDQGIAFKNICFNNDEKYSMFISLDERMTVKISDYQHLM